MLSFGRAAAAALFVLSAAAAHACGNGRVLLDDAFNALDARWGPADEFMSVKDGQMVISERQGEYYTALAEPLFQDVDYCATVKLVEASATEGAYGGITFWGKDYDDFTTFQITLDGYATAYHYLQGEWTALIEDRETSTIRKDASASNELRAVISGNKATLYINGTKFDVVSGTMPAGGQRVGFTVEAPEGGSATFALDNLKVNAAVAGK